MTTKEDAIFSDEPVHFAFEANCENWPEPVKIQNSNVYLLDGFRVGAFEIALPSKGQVHYAISITLDGADEEVQALTRLTVGHDITVKIYELWGPQTLADVTPAELTCTNIDWTEKTITYQFAPPDTRHHRWPVYRHTIASTPTLLAFN